MNNNLGIILDPNSFKNIKEVVKKADNYNFHSAWVTELYRSSFEQLTFIAEITKNIKIASNILENEHYGLQKDKERILELREKEMKAIRTAALVGLWNIFLWLGGPIVISMAGEYQE